MQETLNCTTLFYPPEENRFSFLWWWRGCGLRLFLLLNVSYDLQNLWVFTLKLRGLRSSSF